MADHRLNANGELPGSDHVVRYCSGTRIRTDGTPGPGAFFPDDDGYLSVYWLEFARIEDEAARWADMRARMTASGLKLRAQGRLAKLSVGKTKAGVLTQFGRRLEIKHMPVLDDGGPPPDAAHCGIHGVPRESVDVADFFADKLVIEVQPAKL
jgi:hypothetical protein